MKLDSEEKRVHYLPGTLFPRRFVNPARVFFCPLCRHERVLQHFENLTRNHYLQVILLSMVATLLFYPWMGVRSFVLFFIIWAIFESIGKLLFRAELPCPHCGFDAVWYKRDIKMAKKLVEEFWKDKNKTKVTKV